MCQLFDKSQADSLAVRRVHDRDGNLRPRRGPRQASPLRVPHGAVGRHGEQHVPVARDDSRELLEVAGRDRRHSGMEAQPAGALGQAVEDGTDQGDLAAAQADQPDAATGREVMAGWMRLDIAPA